MRELDVMHLGVPKALCCHEPEPGVLVDPGPSASIEGLYAALGDAPVEKILLTHIHLDHAGATGVILRRFPDAEVWVHEKGAPHILDPWRLVASATRLYGDDMDRLWGEIAPVPEENLRVLRGGESIDGFRVEYTPGHASHHVAFLHEATGTALCGDVAGIRIVGDLLMAPTPPPDIDIEAWHDSLRKVEAWAPERVALTHFGSFGDAAQHLARLHEELDRSVEMASKLDAAGYQRWMEERYAEVPEEASYVHAGPPQTLYPGLERYLRNR